MTTTHVFPCHDAQKVVKEFDRKAVLDVLHEFEGFGQTQITDAVDTDWVVVKLNGVRYLFDKQVWKGLATNAVKMAMVGDRPDSALSAPVCYVDAITGKAEWADGDGLGYLPVDEPEEAFAVFTALEEYELADAVEEEGLDAVRKRLCKARQ